MICDPGNGVGHTIFVDLLSGLLAQVDDVMLKMIIIFGNTNLILIGCMVVLPKMILNMKLITWWGFQKHIIVFAV